MAKSQPNVEPAGPVPAAPATPVAVAEPEPRPQTAEQIAESEKVLGLTPATKPERVPVRMGVAPTTIEEAWRLAQFIAKSELVPKGYRERPADVLVAMQYGMEVGLPPMAALHSIYVTNGRPQLWGDGLLAVVMASPRYRDHDEYYMVGDERREFLVAVDLAKDDTMAVTTFWRSDSQRPRTATFSIAKAKKAGLWTKAGPWQEYPDRMLKLRARSFAAHDCFPDVLRGIHSAEELTDMPAPLGLPEPEPPKEVRRRSETKPSAPAVEASVAPAVTIGPIGVKQIDQFLGGYTVTLADGQRIDIENELDALEIEKFIGTDHALRFECVKADGGSIGLKSFAIAD